MTFDRRPLLRALAAAALAGALAACGTATQGGPSSPLQGRWTPEFAQLGGAAFPITAFGGDSLQLLGDSYEFAGDKGTFRVVEQGSLPALNIVGQAGPNAGRVIQAIYLLDNDTLTVCYQLGRGNRPQAYTSPAGTEILLVRYRRG